MQYPAPRLAAAQRLHQIEQAAQLGRELRRDYRGTGLRDRARTRRHRSGPAPCTTRSMRPKCAIAASTAASTWRASFRSAPEHEHVVALGPHRASRAQDALAFVGSRRILALAAHCAGSGSDERADQHEACADPLENRLRQVQAHVAEAAGDQHHRPLRQIGGRIVGRCTDGLVGLDEAAPAAQRDRWLRRAGGELGEQQSATPGPRRRRCGRREGRDAPAAAP